ncbi:MAG: hypothetical protein JWP47_2274 [Polaromonas sp.]|jgi:hypothetical protein|nr:hypothetical protein [Polaromonas sp.]
MSNASIGPGTADDSNENHPRDSNPSKTLGAEAGGHSDAADEPQAASGEKLRFDNDAANLPQVESLVTPGPALQPVPSGGVPVNPEAYPDGPNIEASPWELEAARGHSELP